MATLKVELKEILQKYDIDPRDKSKLWDCHGTLVLYHRAYEVIAAREGIWFDPPVIIEGRSADKIVALLVTGRMGDRTEWSIGEAAPGNCKNAYVYAIAEKRAKDRVIAKLVGLAEHVYSEDEAEEFKEARRQAATAEAWRQATTEEAPVKSWNPSERQKPTARERIHKAIDEATLPSEIDAIIGANTEALARIKKGGPEIYESLMLFANTRKMTMYAAA